jgi:hypothetical protein
LVPGKNVPSSSKVYAALNKQRGGRVHHNTVKKYLTKMSIHRKAIKTAPKTTERQQSVIKARLKLLTKNIFSEKLIYKCVMDESYFTVDAKEWQQQRHYESEDYPATEDVNLLRKTKFPAKVKAA